jgi:glyoxylase-like metal-dependent hydrolase (beta-lactamase superfamily II)
MALHHAANGGTMVLGDALINFEPHGFGFLPAKYCLNARMMRRSLRKLLDYAFDRMFFAHGTPILSGARARVEQLLTSTR